MAKTVSLHDGMEVYDPTQVEEIERLSVGELERDINRVCHKILQHDFEEQKKKWAKVEFKHL